MTATPDHISHLRPDQLAESPTNPRRTYSEQTLRELAADITAQGILQPITARPMAGPLGEEYQIIFGHRRYRAALLAKLERIPTIVRAMTDLDAARAQISENLGREDVHPIEEGEGFRALLRDHGLTAEQIMAQTGKSRSYVYGRIKLAEHLVPDVRQACLDGKIDAEVALLIARLRHPKLQSKALKAIEGKFLHIDDGGKKSFRNIKELLREQFTLQLNAAMFDTADALLCPEAGACTTCPKLAGNAPEYADLLDATKGHHYTRTTRADDCTDPECWATKTAAHLKAQAAALEAQGKRLVVGSAARAAIGADGKIKGAYVPLASVRAEIKRTKADVPTVTIQDPRTGKTVEAVRQADLVSVGLAEKAKASTSAGKSPQDAHAKRRAQAEAKARAKTEENWALLRRVRAAVAEGPRRVEDLREIALILLDARNSYSQLARLHSEDDKPSQNGWADGRQKSLELEASIPHEQDANALAQLCLDLIMIECVEANSYNLDNEPEPLLRLAAAYGVVPTEAQSTPSTAARAPAGAQEGQAPAGENNAALAPAVGTRKGKAKPPRGPAAQAPAEAAQGEPEDGAWPRLKQSDEAGSAGEEQKDEPAHAGGFAPEAAWPLPKRRGA